MRFTSGVICMPMLGSRLDELQLPLMVPINTESHRTAFTVSVDIKARHRHLGRRPLAHHRHPDRPGHAPGRPGQARPPHLPAALPRGRRAQRAGHTEATVDLARMAGRYPARVLSEIVNEDGTMAQVPDLERFAVEHELPILTIADLIGHRRQHEKLIRRVAEPTIPTRWGDFTCYAYESLLDGEQHVALVKGAVQGMDEVLVRVHSECLTGDAFGSLRCDCGPQHRSRPSSGSPRRAWASSTCAATRGRGIGLAHKLAPYNLQENGRDTVDANLELGLPVDGREYGIGSRILVDLGITTMRLMTNNPAKYGGLEGFGLKIVERIAAAVPPDAAEPALSAHQARERMEHLLELPGEQGYGGSDEPGE